MQRGGAAVRALHVHPQSQTPSQAAPAVLSVLTAASICWQRRQAQGFGAVGGRCLQAALHGWSWVGWPGREPPAACGQALPPPTAPAKAPHLAGQIISGLLDVLRGRKGRPAASALSRRRPRCAVPASTRAEGHPCLLSLSSRLPFAACTSDRRDCQPRRSLQAGARRVGCGGTVQPSGTQGPRGPARRGAQQAARALPPSLTFDARQDARSERANDERNA